MDDIGMVDSRIKDFESWDEAKIVFQEEHARALQERSNLERKIQQSRLEVDRLANRNASVTAHLQRIQSGINEADREEIRTTYDSALDALQRLFIMRGQLDKLQQERDSLQKYIELLEGVNQMTSAGTSKEPGSKGSFATVEMLIQGQESERQRLSKLMHDGPAQSLSNFILQAEIATRLFDVDQAKARDELQVLKDTASTTFQQVRDFIFQLRPMMLDDLGVVPTVRRYVDTVKNQSGLEIEMTVTGVERRLESYLEVVIFRSLQELLGNAVTHSQATEIQVQLDLTDVEARASVEDNGRGFDISEHSSDAFTGLKLIRERAEMLGGFFEIDSVIGQGSRVVLSVPIGLNSA
jgi:two-component system sensor histidine kinase DegS